MTDVTIYSRDGTSETLPIGAASERVRLNPKIWGFIPPDPPGWDTEVPIYKASRDLHPSPNPRHRTEKPFTLSTDNSCWQQSERVVKANEIVSTTEWPHNSLVPQNTAARRVYEFFTSRQRSRLQVKPWRNGRVFLDDGLTFANVQLPEPANPRSAA